MCVCVCDLDPQISFILQMECRRSQLCFCGAPLQQLSICTSEVLPDSPPPKKKEKKNKGEQPPTLAYSGVYIAHGFAHDAQKNSAHVKYSL